MKHFLDIFDQRDIIGAYTSCRAGQNKKLLNDFMEQLSAVIAHVQVDAGIYKTNDRTAFRMGKELFEILVTISSVLVPPEAGTERPVTIHEQLDNAIRQTNRILG